MPLISIEPLATTARALVAGGKGILAADESTPTCTKRFEKLGIASTEGTRRDYRELLFTAPGLGEFVSGAILYDETLRQSTNGGTPLRKVLESQGILAGIKVDTGAKALAGHSDETVTEGLDGLRDRLSEYARLGAQFTKWRAVYRIGEGIPSPACLGANAHGLARYAALAQEAGLVPIVEPEVLMEGDHDIEACDGVTEEVLRSVFAELAVQEVAFEGILLKPSMVISGKSCPRQAEVQEVAERTVRRLRRTVPAAVPGIVFLSGGQSDELATKHLNAMNAMAGQHPWKLSFSYGRALQSLALERWNGAAENIAYAQQALYCRAKFNSAASRGAYTWDMEQELQAA